jgi:hypothetical protein
MEKINNHKVHYVCLRDMFVYVFSMIDVGNLDVN